MNKQLLIGLMLLLPTPVFGGAQAFDPDAIVEYQEPLLQPKPDCQEKKITIEELDALAKSPDVKNMEDFLNKIPKDTLQTFTFVTNSLSLHRGNEKGEGKVSAMWPRVVRTSVDGKISVSFVCDPKNPTYGKVETLFFDDNGKQLKSVEWDFGPKDKPNRPQDRTHENPSSCISCHAGTTLQGKADLKHIMPEYFFWGDCVSDRGITMYGSSDDRMVLAQFRPRSPSSSAKLPEGCTEAKDQAAMKAEVENYKKFRDLQRGNACFNSLPWLKQREEKIEPNSRVNLYPYQGEYSSGALSLRPNLRLNSVFSQVRAKQMLESFKKFPQRYNEIKYALLLEQSCVNRGVDRQEFAKKMGLYNPGPNIAVEFDNQSVVKKNPLMYGFSRSIGLQDKDWNLDFRSNDPTYNGGIGTVFDYLAGEILQDVLRENPKLSPQSERAFQRFFEGNYDSYSCLDNAGKGVKTYAYNGYNENGTVVEEWQKKYCQDLEQANREYMVQRRELAALGKELDCPTGVVDSTVQAKKIGSDVKTAVKIIDQESIARGRELVKVDNKGKCIYCHSPKGEGGRLPPDLRFVPDEKDDHKTQEETLGVLAAKMKEGFSDRLFGELILMKNMPPMRNSLTDSDREDIANYIRSLSAK